MTPSRRKPSVAGRIVPATILIALSGALVLPSLSTARGDDWPAVMKLGKLNGRDGFRIDGDTLDGSLGRSLTGLGDINGDGVDDFMVAGSYGGEGDYVFFGSKKQFPRVSRVKDFDRKDGFIIDGIATSMAGAGDINRDGYSDIIVGYTGGSDQRGEAYVIFGRKNFPATVRKEKLDGTDGFRIVGPHKGSRFGASVAGIGDIDGDNIDDILIGAEQASVGGKEDVGRAYAIFGHKGRFARYLEVVTMKSSEGFRLDGASAGDSTGSKVAGLRDIDRDGFDDFIIVAPYANPRGREFASASYVVFGQSRFSNAISLDKLDGRNGFRIDGAWPQMYPGISAAAAGDVNDDGYDDIVIGSRTGRRWGMEARDYVIFGHDRPFPDKLDLRRLPEGDGFEIVPTDFNAGTGYAVAGVGDVDSDGIDDLAVSEVFYNDYVGAIYIVFGRTAFPQEVLLSDVKEGELTRIDGMEQGADPGRALAAAGDVDGDGIPDVMIGAPSQDVENKYWAGAAFMIFGR